MCKTEILYLYNSPSPFLLVPGTQKYLWNEQMKTSMNLASTLPIKAGSTVPFCWTPMVLSSHLRFISINLKWSFFFAQWNSPQGRNYELFERLSLGPKAQRPILHVARSDGQVLALILQLLLPVIHSLLFDYSLPLASRMAILVFHPPHWLFVPFVGSSLSPRLLMSKCPRAPSLFFSLLCIPLVISPHLRDSNISYMLMMPRFLSKSGPLLWTPASMSYCLLQVKWIRGLRHVQCLKLHMSNTDPWPSSYLLPPESYPSHFNPLIIQLHKPTGLESFLSPLFLSYSTSNPYQNWFFYLKIYSEYDHFSSPPLLPS